ncbi:MAG: hypothetical protein DBX08_07510 [Nitrosopumilus sp.]|nr:MAG: hypothetical protein DBX08_07510 [Nitrosopumilus sp.]
MSDMLLDDVNSLLDGDFGDDRILKQIARACKNNEVISNYERNYVQKLAEQHLGKKPITTIKKSTIVTTEIPKIDIPKPEPIISSTSSQFTQNPKNSKNYKLFLGFGGVALIAIVAAALLLSNIDSSTSNPVTEIKVQLSIQTDLSSYAYKDLISINGISENSNVVNLSIKNQDNKLIWAEQVSVKNSGIYSTLAIAGGVGWENSGTYTLEADNGSEIKSTNFSFNS